MSQDDQLDSENDNGTGHEENPLVEEALERGWTALEEGDTPAARRQALEVERLAPGSADGLLLLAACEREDGRDSEAVALLEKAAKADPEWAAPPLWMAEILAAGPAGEGADESDEAAKKRTQEALGLVSRALDLSDDEEDFLSAVLLKARLELELDRDDDAEDTLSELPPAEVGELPVEMMLEAADLLFRVGRAEDAEARLRVLVAREPAEADAWHMLGILADERDDEDGRRDAWLRTRELDLREAETVPANERLSEETLEAVASAALAELPPEAREKLANVPIVVAEVPARQDVEQGVDPRALGLFAGSSLLDGDGAAPALTQILLFRYNLEREADDEDELRDEIRLTLLHEAGHFFGMSESDLAAVDLD